MAMRIDCDRLVYSYEPGHPPAAEVHPGQIVRVVTHDRFQPGADLTELWSLDRSPVAAVTGPIEVEGTRAGESVAIKIHGIVIDEETGVIFSAPGKGAWGDHTTTPSFRRVPIAGGQCLFSPLIRIPLRPHVGRIAVAPAHERYPTATVGPYGGNMDISDLGPGSILILPVFVEGAMVVVGDLHAAMGDGECNCSGIEVAGEITLSFHPSGLPLSRPLVITADQIMCVADGDTLDEAVRLAASDMVSLLSSNLQLDTDSARQLVSAAADIKVCQIVNPRATARAVISRSICPGETIFRL